MIEFDMKDLLPRFILRDKNGYALAKAIEACMTMTCQIVKQGVSILSDVNAMPEWRLDEMAWEYNMFYDYQASIDEKMGFIREARSVYKRYGTPAIIEQLGSGLYGNCEVIEWWAYDGEYPSIPYHFYVRTSGVQESTKSANVLAWIINQVKNVRSVFDGLVIETDANVAELYVGVYMQCADMLSIGLEERTWPF